MKTKMNAKNAVPQSHPTAGLGRCGTCKNFARFTDEFDREYHGDHAGKCSSRKFIYDSGAKPPLDGLRYWDYEGDSAGFEVGDQFGCIHWVRSNAKLTGGPSGPPGSATDWA